MLIEDRDIFNASLTCVQKKKAPSVFRKNLKAFSIVIAKQLSLLLSLNKKSFF